MAPFRYENRDPRFDGTIAELMMRGPEARARAAENIAAIQARGAQQQAGAWSGAIENIGQTIMGIPQQIQQQKRAALQDQMGALQLGGMQQAANDDALLRKALSLSQNGDLSQAVEFLKAQGGAGIPALQKLTTMAQQQKEQHDIDAGEIGYRLHLAGNSPDAVKRVMTDAVKTGALKPDEAQQFYMMSVEDPTKIPDVSRQLMAKSPKHAPLLEATATVKDGETVYNKFTQQPIEGLSRPNKKPDYTINGQRFSGDGTPIGAVQPSQTAHVPRPLPEQLLEAIASGETAKANQIKQTLHDPAPATRDPAQVALANELGALRRSEAQARLDALREKAKPLDVSPDVQTTGSGRKYIDLSSYSAQERDRARDAATAGGAVGVSKEQANALQEIDNARMNQQSIQSQIEGLLPKNPGQRAIAAVTTPLAKMFQTDEQVAAFNSWRTAAIQTLRATAGSKGLRINKAEIEQAVENDIPKLTDTVKVAQQKVKNINTMLENAEKSILVRDRSVAPAQTAPIPTLTPGLLKLKDRP